MAQKIESVNQTYLHAATPEQLEDERELAQQRRQAAHYRREREIETSRDYANEYW